ncbi:hypothetical protein FKM82_008473 [Ascaphus truei]
MISTLPAAMLQSMPLLESLYLHGNPWACDCHLKWLLEWDEMSNGVLKCKKDKSYENGQLCSMCSSPKQLQNQEIQSLKDVSCFRPTIYSPLKANSSDTYSEENDNDLQLMQSHQALLGKIILNMTDEHGNKVNLDCEMKKPIDYSKILWNQLHPEEIDVNATFVLDFECPMNRENYEKLWKLIAYYSEVPVKLQRELMFSKHPKVIYRYRQDLEHDSYYYTGVKALIMAEPTWVMQSLINIQLNRKNSTAKKVTLSFSTHFSQSIHTKDIQYPQNNWVMIEKSEKHKTSHSVVKKGVCQLNCNVKSSGVPSIEWILPDGTTLKAPYDNKDSRFSISASGHLVIQAVDFSDSGVYYCIAQVKHEMDVLPFRVVVQPPVSEISESNIRVVTKSAGEPITLPCNAVANPNAELNWILPNNHIIDALANKTSIYILNNGSLMVPNSKPTDSGFYRCIAVNQHGTDHYSVQVTINKKVSDNSYKISKIENRPVLEGFTKVKHDVIDDDGGSGEKDTQEESAKYHNVHDKVLSSKNKSPPSSTVRGKQNRKDRKKMKALKSIETVKDSNIAEGRRKFESRRRINMGNKQIDPQQWANILAKVRGKNVQRTTEFPLLLTTTKVTTAPTSKQKAPSSTTKPPLKPMVESTINMEEASADGSHLNEYELVFITSSPQVTIKDEGHDLTSLGDHRVSTIANEKINEYSKNEFSENDQETFIIESSTATSTMLTLENVDIDLLDYSIDEEESKSYFTELNDINSTVTNSVQTIETDHITEHTSRNTNLGNYLEEQPHTTEMQTILEEHNAETDFNLNEMENNRQDIFTKSMDDTKHFSTVKAFTVTTSPLQFVFEESVTTDKSDILHTFLKISTHHSAEPNDKNNMHGYKSNVLKEGIHITSTANKELKTIKAMTHHEEILSNAKDILEPKSKSVTPLPIDTIHNIDLFIPTRTLSPPPVTDSIGKGESGVKYSVDPVQHTKQSNTYLNEKSTVSFWKVDEITRAAEATDKAYVSKHHVFSNNNKIGTTTAMTQHEEILRSAMDSMIPKSSIDTTLNTDFLVPTRTLSPTLVTYSIGESEVKYSVDSKQTKKMNTNINEISTASFGKDEYQITRAAKSTEKTFVSQPHAFPAKTEYQLMTTSIPGRLTTTIPINTHRKTTTPLLLTNGNVQYPRRRPNGRRRFRPNRFRQQQNQVIPTIPSTTQTSMKTFIQKPFVSVSEGERTTKMPLLLNKSKDDIYYQTRKNVHFEDITSKEPVLQQSSENRKYNIFSPTTSIPETKRKAHTTTAEALELPLVAPVTTETFKKYSTGNTDSKIQLYTLRTDMNKIAITVHDFQTSTFKNKTSYDAGKAKAHVSNTVYNNELSTVHTTINPSQPLYVESNISFPQEDTVGLHREIHHKTTTVSEPLPLIELQSIIPITSMTENVLKDLTIKATTTPTVTSPPNTRKTVTAPNRLENVFFEKIENKSSVTPSSEMRRFLYEGMKKNIIRPMNHTIRPEATKTILVSPVTHNVFVPITHNSTSATTQSLFMQIKVNKGTKEHEKMTQMESTKASKIVQTSTPSSRQNEFGLILSNQNKMYIQPKQEQFKNTGAKSNNSLLFNTNLHHQPRIIPNNQHHFITPLPYSPVRGTMRPPYLGTQGPLHYFITNQPLPITNKPEITAYTALNFQERKSYTPQIFTTTPATTTTTIVIPLFRPKPISPSRFNNQGQRLSPNPRPFGNNVITNGKGTAARIPNQGNPYYINPRIQHHFNRSKPFRFAATLKPSVPTSVSTSNKNNIIFPSARTTALNAIISTAVAHVPTVTKAPTSSTIMSSTNRVVTTTPPDMVQTRTTQQSSTIQSHWYTHHNIHRTPVVSNKEESILRNSNVFPPSVNIRIHGERPKITTTGFQSLSVQFEMDALFPCETVGYPKPFITWTKVATGAIMSTNTRIQRFEVLQNGTLLIRNLQLQDQGQYMCTAQNQHGTDKMLVTLTVVRQQPNMVIPRYKDVTVYLGDTITMDCNARGVPSPHISWIFPDRKIVRTVSTMQSRIMLYENGTLSIKETTFSDRGIFKCVASNVAGVDSLTVRLQIAALPPIIQQEKIENISLPQSHSIYIHCSAKGAPLPSIRWVLFDGTQIRPSQIVNGNVFVFPNGTLYIRKISLRDIGKYECIATNIVGSARRTVTLDVKKYSSNAKITGSSPQKTDVTYGSTLRLDCSVAGDPWPRILWRLPSKRLVDSFFSFDSRIKTYSNGTLVVYSVTEKDAGDYLCMARNKLGDDYVVLKVNVMMKPAKIEHKNEADHKVTYGGDLKVDCVATGVPNPEISWSLPDGSMINTIMQSDDSGIRMKRYGVFNNGTLYFNEVGMKEEGDYTCYAVNQHGQDEMRVSVKVVAEGAVIKNKTYSTVSVSYGDVITVSCEAKGEPIPKITWLSPANRPIPALSDKYQVYRDGTLLIQKTQRSDSGNYTCLAQNNAGEDKKIVQIQVNVLPPKINGHSNKIIAVKETAMKDSRMLIDCKAEGIPTPRVMWAFPEGVILPAPYYGNRITVHRNGTLDIKVLRKTDSVQLICIGRNEGGEARLIVQLTVTEPAEKPKFNTDNENVVVAEGQTVSLNCSALGKPEPERTWILPNGTQLQSGNHLHGIYHKSDGTLHIGTIAVTDAGTYRCKAVNIAGYADRLVFLKIGHKPQISNHYNNLVSIINGETLQLHCTTHGEPQTHISWTLPNGMVLDGTQTKGRFSLLQNGSLVVRDASVYDRGTYLCKATTPYGSSTMNVPVIVIAYPPRITSGPAPVIYSRPGNSVQLNCMSIGIPKAEITWELPDKSHLTAGAQSRLYGNKFLHPQGTLVIQHPSQRDAGYYKCTAKNILGSDTKTTYIHIY